MADPLSTSDSTTGPGRRRYAIASAAIRLFSERGLEATTVDDIAAAAGVAPRTFFRHFATKEHAAFPDHAERVAELRQWLAAHRSTSDPLRAAVEVAQATAAEYFEDAELYRPRVQLVRTHRELRDLERIIDQGYEAALIEYFEHQWQDDERAPLNARLVSAAILAAVNHVLDLWAFNPELDGEEALAQALGTVATVFRPLIESQDRDAEIVLRLSAAQDLLPGLQALGQALIAASSERPDV